MRETPSPYFPLLQGVIGSIRPSTWTRLLACLVLAAPAACNALKHDAGAGPLFSPDYRASSSGFPVYAARPFSWSYVTVQNHGQHLVVLSRVALTNPSAGLETIKVFVFPTGHAGQLSVNEPTFHQLPAMRPLAGFEVDPGKSFVLVFELKVPADGNFTAGGVSLSYTAAGQEFEVSYPDMLRVCAPYGLTVGCEAQAIS